jgi:glycosyltransferase involved in cell wall biosynthesis
MRAKALPGSRLKIIRIVARLNIGGPAIHTILLTAGLDRTRFESLLVTGLTGPHEGDMLGLAAAKGVSPLIIPELGRELDPWRDLTTLAKLYRLFRRERPQLVHTHTAKAGAVGRLAARMAGVPAVVHTFHGHVFHGYFGPRKTRFFVALERFLARLSDCIVTVSEGQRRELAAYGIAPLEKIAVVPLGFDLEPFLTVTWEAGHRWRRAMGLPNGVPLVGIVARLTGVKNHQLFLDVARRVADAVPDTRFAVVGDGELRAELKAYAADLNLSNRITFTGWVDDMPSVYAGLDVVVLTSLNEGTPVTLIEGMAAGRPVVSTAVGGVPDIVAAGASGLLSPSGDAAGLAQAIVALLRDPDRRRAMGLAGRESVRRRFDVRRLIGDVERLYLELLIAKGVRVSEGHRGSRVVS